MSIKNVINNKNDHQQSLLMFPTTFCIIDCLCSIVDQRTLLTLSELSDKWYQITKPYIDKCGLSDELSLNRQLELYCRNNNLIQLKKLIKAHANQLDWRYGLIGASATGNLALISLFESLTLTENDITFNDAFEELCQSKIDVSTILIFKSPLCKSDILDKVSSRKGIRGACIAGRLDLLKSLITLKSSPMDKEDWDEMFYYACKGGYQEIIDYFIINGVDDWNNGLLGASAGGHLALVEKMLTKGANSFDSALYYACSENHEEIVYYLLPFPNCYLGLLGACRAGNLPFIKLMIEHGALDDRNEEELMDIYEYAIESGKLEIVQYIDEILTIEIPNASKLHTAVTNGHINLVKYYLQFVIDIDELNVCFDMACGNKDYDIMILLIDAGVTSCGSCYNDIIDHRHNPFPPDFDTYTFYSLLDILKKDKHLIEIAKYIFNEEHLLFDEFEESEKSLKTKLSKIFPTLYIKTNVTPRSSGCL